MDNDFFSAVPRIAGFCIGYLSCVIPSPVGIVVLTDQAGQATSKAIETAFSLKEGQLSFWFSNIISET